MNDLRASFTRRFPGGLELCAQDFTPRRRISVLFGASGSGKTTLLRCLAGLDKPDAGEIYFGGEVWFREPARNPRKEKRIFVPPSARNVGFVPQDYALFPHLSVAQNIAYGLRHLPAREQHSRTSEALAWLDILPLAQRRPPHLSGGEQQRVALARAVVRRPRLLLLDEPFSALDTPTRQRLRAELAALLDRLNTPAILVTHDRLEAASLGQEIFVLGAGRILQHGTVDDVFNRPASLEVARLAGTDTVLACEILELADGLATLAVGAVRLMAMADAVPHHLRHAHVCIRAEDVILSGDTRFRISSRNRFESVVRTLAFEGPLVRIELDCGFPLKALLTRQACAELRLEPGKRITALVKASQIHVI